MPLTLISATPSPYARKVRVALLEKKIPFTLQTEVPWDSTTTIPQWNPLEKLPVLIIDPSSSKETSTPPKAIYESSHILDYIDLKYRKSPPSLLPDANDPENIDAILQAKQISVLADGMCDALVLMFFEKQRGEGHVSESWTQRQRRKVEGGLKALDALMQEEENEAGEGKRMRFLVDDTFGLADVAVGCLLGYMDCRWPDHKWKEMYPKLERYLRMLEKRESFATTKPSPQVISDRVV